MTDSEEILIIFENVVRLDQDTKPRLELINNPLLKNVNENSNSSEHELLDSVDDRLQISSFNDLDYDFGLDELSDLLLSDENLTANPDDKLLPTFKNDIALHKDEIKKPLIPSKPLSRLKTQSNVIGKRLLGVQKKVRPKKGKENLTVLLKAINRINIMDNQVSDVLTDILEKASEADIKKLNERNGNTIDVLMHLSYIVNDHLKRKDNQRTAKYDNVESFIKNSIFKCAQKTSASSEPKLLGNTLIDFQPNFQKINFDRWAKYSGELFMNKVCDVAVGRVSNPLGCAYDPTIGFLFTGPNEILCCSENGVLAQKPMITGLNCPSAVCVVRAGELFGVVDKNGIHACDNLRSLRKSVADTKIGQCRGLAITSDKYFITCIRKQGYSRIALLDPSQENRIVREVPFPIIAEALDKPNPCFITSFENLAYITDLGQNCIVCLDTSDGRLNVVFVRNFGKGSISPTKFEFISGIVMDCRSNLLVADAQTRSLHYLTGLCTSPFKVYDVDNAFPYSSAFAVSNNGYLLACCRKSNRMILLKLSNGSKVEPVDVFFNEEIF